MKTFTVEIDGVVMTIRRDADGKFVTPDSWRGIGSALKPAWEPIVLARKPLSEGTIAANVLQHGTGAINVDACRVGTLGGTSKAQSNEKSETHSVGGYLNAKAGTPINEGRWPANIVHDGSDEVLAAFPDVHGAGAARAGSSNPRPVNYNGSVDIAPDRNTGDMMRFGDSGSAARFFFEASPDIQCEICRHIIDGIAPWNADTAPNTLKTESTPAGNTAPPGVPDSQPPETEGSARQSERRASGAVKSFTQCHRPTAGSVPLVVDRWPLEKIARNVSSAAVLCFSCATAIAQHLAEVRRSGSAALSHSKCSIEGSSGIILSQSLARYVAGRESTDIILTTESLRELFGSVFHAIAARTNSERSEASTESDLKRLWYSSKADAEDRLGSKHPTVKPVSLMRWLVRMVTPPGGLVLDPFAGTGTTGMACIAEKFRAILIEREEEYLADIKRRIEFARGEGPLAQRATMSRFDESKAKGDDTPLFSGAA